jgi:2-keto-4-pentenoate hydratase/2-oxohepta-3-ene-1,7-dioic acid hydratase in catechol pathway
VPQNSAAKSFPGFGPVRPLLAAPGDVIFTGTPPGVGVGRVPQHFLKPGDELVTYVQGVGEMRHTMQ